MKEGGPMLRLAALFVIIALLTGAEGLSGRAGNGIFAWYFFSTMFFGFTIITLLIEVGAGRRKRRERIEHEKRQLVHH